MRISTIRPNSSAGQPTSRAVLSESIDAKKLDVRLDQQGDQALAWLDLTRFQQIVWNLLTNAIKFSHDEGTVQVTLAWEAQKLTLVVEEHGKGVAPEFLPRLFDRFSQSDAPGYRLYGGLGLGQVDRAAPGGTARGPGSRIRRWSR
ncbi:sensor histidine kinase [Variovorax gracilis]|uniref:sensor histidine kinase n=1 Tax=Variovorax gracilis TaxID=3053502 RepID=UPI00336BFB18